MEQLEGATTTSVEATVGAIADGIMADLGVADNPTPEPEPQPTPITNTETPAQEEPKHTPETQKEKIKWQGQDVEVTPEELRNLAQQGYDYTKKTQELSDRASKIAPLEGLAKHIENDPAFAAHIATYFKGQKEQQQVFDDPIEQLKYDTRQEALKEVEQKYIKPFEERFQMMTHQQAINQVKAQVQADPDYSRVQAAIVDYVKALPPSMQQTTYLQLDQDPKAYMEMFQHFKTKLPTSTNKSTVEVPQPVTKKERAPLLEASGQENAGTGESERKAKLSRMRQKALSSGDPVAISDWLLKTGTFDDLFKKG